MANQTLIDRLARLLAHYENAAASLRTVIAIVSEPSTTGRPGAGLPGALSEAIGMDAARRATMNGATPHGAAPGRKRKPYDTSGAYAAKLQQRRNETAEHLKGFDTKTARRPVDVLGKGKARYVGGWIRAGYLKRKGGGYVRTAKPFIADMAEARAAGENPR